MIANRNLWETGKFFSLILTKQTAHVKDRLFWENRKLVAEELGICEIEYLEDSFVIMDIEKTLELLDP